HAVCVLCFFFQAEDGIRAATVTGVQTCALPISLALAGGSYPPIVAAACAAAPKGGASWFSTTWMGIWFKRVSNFDLSQKARKKEIGRASCRERGESRGSDRAVKRKRKGVTRS